MKQHKKSLPMVEKNTTNRDDFFKLIPSDLSTLEMTQDMFNQVGKTGFDWPDWKPVIDKIYEETNEVIEAVDNNESFERIEEELGDLLIVVVNLARHLNVDAETAIQKANTKFKRRFIHVLEQLHKTNPNQKEWELDTMEQAWKQVKKQEKK